LVATWKRKLADDAGIAAIMPKIIEKLAPPPQFHLPPATLGHTRHFMPLKFSDQGDRTKVFDAFIALDPGAEVVLLWPDAELNAEERPALDRALSRLGYLGRAESWCSARIADEWNERAETCWTLQAAQCSIPRINCMPLAGDVQPSCTEPVRVLVPDPAAWNLWSFEGARLPDPPWNILAETADLHDERWSDPPGSRWVVYVRRSDCFEVASTSKPVRSSAALPNVARFVLDGSVLPLVEETLAVAETMRRVLLRVCHPENCAVLSGKDPSGEPRLDNHEHAFYLPTAEAADSSRLTHVTVFAHEGFGPPALRAIEAIRWLPWPPPNVMLPGRAYCRPRFEAGTVSLLLTGLGQTTLFAASKLFGPAKVWRAATPFVVTRHLKRRGQKRDAEEFRDGLDGQRAFARQVLLEELGRRGLQPERVEPLEGHRIGPRRLAPLQFRRFRRKAGDDGGRRACGAFRIEFAERAAGPIALGHSCHFGLGLFLADTEA